MFTTTAATKSVTSKHFGTNRTLGRASGRNDVEQISTAVEAHEGKLRKLISSWSKVGVSSLKTIVLCHDKTCFTNILK